MLLIREFESRLDKFFVDGRLHGTTHPCTGQEATAVGACAGIRPTDYVVSNHRGHGHFIAKTGTPERLMAELFGKATGVSGGRGGSQHIADIASGFLASNGITGGGLPIAAGAALSIKMQGRDQVVLCFFGDGAANQGTFHESVNMAAIWKLPLILFCENNLYAMSTPFNDAFPVSNVSDRADGYAMPGKIIDGNDVCVVRDAVREAARHVRSGAGPYLVEALTYRHCGHSKSDGCEYRPDAEEAEWALKDPIKLLRKKLLDAVPQQEIDSIEQAVRNEIDEAVAFALDSPQPSTDDLEGSIWAN
ncbi:MAG: thiamine pyrophosphate-dependent dehydrogenase E1 component subunit alpha [Planctomycetes bacterium]|nr:thiamine pyrophosphate-dependent dehydrogenase E1 component subunit alpha [Planctomycetota bacterium]